MVSESCFFDYTCSIDFTASIFFSAELLYHYQLNPKNYFDCKTQFEPLLNCHKLKEFINYGTIPDPCPPPLIPNFRTSTLESNPAYDYWFRKDQTLLSWIRSSISEEVFTYVVGLKTSFEVFTTPDDPSRSHPVSSSSQDT